MTEPSTPSDQAVPSRRAFVAVLFLACLVSISFFSYCRSYYEGHIPAFMGSWKGPSLDQPLEPREMTVGKGEFSTGGQVFYYLFNAFSYVSNDIQTGYLWNELILPLIAMGIIFLLSRQIFPRKLACSVTLGAAILLLTCNNIGNNLFAYLLSTPLFLSALLLFQHPGKRFAALPLGLFFGLALQIHFTYMLMLAPLAALLVYRRKELSIKGLALGVLAFAIAMTPYWATFPFFHGDKMGILVHDSIQAFAPESIFGPLLRLVQTLVRLPVLLFALFLTLSLKRFSWCRYRRFAILSLAWIAGPIVFLSFYKGDQEIVRFYRYNITFGGLAFALGVLIHELSLFLSARSKALQLPVQLVLVIAVTLALIGATFPLAEYGGELNYEERVNFHKQPHVFNTVVTVLAERINSGDASRVEVRGNALPYLIYLPRFAKKKMSSNPASAAGPDTLTVTFSPGGSAVGDGFGSLGISATWGPKRVESFIDVARSGNRETVVPILFIPPDAPAPDCVELLFICTELEHDFTIRLVDNKPGVDRSLFPPQLFRVHRDFGSIAFARFKMWPQSDGGMLKIGCGQVAVASLYVPDDCVAEDR